MNDLESDKTKEVDGTTSTTRRRIQTQTVRIEADSGGATAATPTAAAAVSTIQPPDPSASSSSTTPVVSIVAILPTTPTPSPVSDPPLSESPSQSQSSSTIHPSASGSVSGRVRGRGRGRGGTRTKQVKQEQMIDINTNMITSNPNYHAMQAIAAQQQMMAAAAVAAASSSMLNPMMMFPPADPLMAVLMMQTMFNMNPFGQPQSTTTATIVDIQTTLPTNSDTSNTAATTNSDLIDPSKLSRANSRQSTPVSSRPSSPHQATRLSHKTTIVLDDSDTDSSTEHKQATPMELTSKSELLRHSSDRSSDSDVEIVGAKVSTSSATPRFILPKLTPLNNHSTTPSTTYTTKIPPTSLIRTNKSNNIAGSKSSSHHTSNDSSSTSSITASKSNTTTSSIKKHPLIKHTVTPSIAVKKERSTLNHHDDHPHPSPSPSASPSNNSSSTVSGLGSNLKYQSGWDFEGYYSRWSEQLGHDIIISSLLLAVGSWFHFDSAILGLGVIQLPTGTSEGGYSRLVEDSLYWRLNKTEGERMNLGVDDINHRWKEALRKARQKISAPIRARIHTIGLAGGRGSSGVCIQVTRGPLPAGVTHTGKGATAQKSMWMRFVPYAGEGKCKCWSIQHHAQNNESKQAGNKSDSSTVAAAATTTTTKSVSESLVPLYPFVGAAIKSGLQQGSFTDLSLIIDDLMAEEELFPVLHRLMPILPKLFQEWEIKSLISKDESTPSHPFYQSNDKGMTTDTTNQSLKENDDLDTPDGIAQFIRSLSPFDSTKYSSLSLRHELAFRKGLNYLLEYLIHDQQFHAWLAVKYEIRIEIGLVGSSGIAVSNSSAIGFNSSATPVGSSYHLQLSWVPISELLRRAKIRYIISSFGSRDKLVAAEKAGYILPSEREKEKERLKQKEAEAKREREEKEAEERRLKLKEEKEAAAAKKAAKKAAALKDQSSTVSASTTPIPMDEVELHPPPPRRNVPLRGWNSPEHFCFFPTDPTAIKYSKVSLGAMYVTEKHTQDSLTLDPDHIHPISPWTIPLHVKQLFTHQPDEGGETYRNRVIYECVIPYIVDRWFTPAALHQMVGTLFPDLKPLWAALKKSGAPGTEGSFCDWIHEAIKLLFIPDRSGALTTDGLIFVRSQMMQQQLKVLRYIPPTHRTITSTTDTVSGMIPTLASGLGSEAKSVTPIDLTQPIPLIPSTSIAFTSQTPSADTLLKPIPQQPMNTLTTPLLEVAAIATTIPPIPITTPTTPTAATPLVDSSASAPMEVDSSASSPAVTSDRLTPLVSDMVEGIQYKFVKDFTLLPPPMVTTQLTTKKPTSHTSASSSHSTTTGSSGRKRPSSDLAAAAASGSIVGTKFVEPGSKLDDLSDSGFMSTTSHKRRRLVPAGLKSSVTSASLASWKSDEHKSAIRIETDENQRTATSGMDGEVEVDEFTSDDDDADDADMRDADQLQPINPSTRLHAPLLPSPLVAPDLAIENVRLLDLLQRHTDDRICRTCSKRIRSTGIFPCGHIVWCTKCCQRNLGLTIPFTKENSPIRLDTNHTRLKYYCPDTRCGKQIEYVLQVQMDTT